MKSRTLAVLAIITVMMFIGNAALADWTQGYGSYQKTTVTNQTDNYGNLQSQTKCKGNRCIFYDAYGFEQGSAERKGNKIIYFDAYGNQTHIQEVQ